MASNGVPSLLLNHATLMSSRANGIGATFTVGSCRNGMGSMRVLVPTELHTNQHGEAPRHMIGLNLRKNDRSKLRKKRFQILEIDYS